MISKAQAEAGQKREEEELRSSSQEMRDLDRKLQDAEKTKAAAGEQRDQVIGTIAKLKDDLATARNILREAETDYSNWESEGSLDEHEAHFPAINTRSANLDLGNPLALEAAERTLGKTLDALVESAREKVAPLHDKLVNAMGRFLNKFDEFGSDLGRTVAFAPDFVALHERIVREDLPSYEEQFKERLNDKAGKEIAVLNASLQREAREIKGSVDLLNEALRSLDYETGKHMQLEAKDVSDPEILKFRSQLRDCQTDSFDNSIEAHESRFKRIETLIRDLQEEPRYRERVTDVRRWFNFFACVISNDSGEEIARYSDASGRSGGEKSKLAFTILVAAITHQYGIDPQDNVSEQFHFVVVDEMFAKMADKFSIYAPELFKNLRLQLLIVAPLDAKARITEDYVNYYALVTKDEETNCSEIFKMSAEEFRELELAERTDEEPA